MCGFCSSAFPHISTGYCPTLCSKQKQHQSWSCRKHQGRLIHIPLTHPLMLVSSQCLHILLRFRTCCHLHKDASPPPAPGSLARARNMFPGQYLKPGFMCTVRNPKVRSKSEQSSATAHALQLFSLSISPSITSCRNTQGSKVNRA